MEPGLTRMLTQEEFEAVRISQPTENQDLTVLSWRDLNGKYHRNDDLPAFIWNNHAICWYQHGKYHRDDDLPAMIVSHGKPQELRVWQQHGVVHRDNGLPAILRGDGTMEWHVDGVKTGDQDDLPPNALFPGQLTKSASKQ